MLVARTFLMTGTATRRCQAS